MKRQNLFFVLPLLLVLSACDFMAVQGAVDDFDLIIQLEPIETYAIGQVVDAGTGDLIAGEVQVRFGGPDGGSVIDFYSDPVRELSVRGGLLSLGIAQGAQPTAASPVRVTVEASAPGYDDASVNLMLTAVGEHTFEIPLVNKAREVEGVRRAEATSWLSNGKTAAFNLNTGNNAAGPSAGVSVPAGSEVIGTSGRALDGTLATELTHYNTTAEAAMKGFPGGFEDVAVDGSSSAGFVPAGFIRLDVRSSSGEAAVEFSQSVTRTIEIAEGTRNPETGRPYRAGDAVQVLRYDNAASQWTTVTTATLEGAAGKSGSSLVAEYGSARTGFEAIGSVVSMCESGRTIRIERNGNSGALEGVIRGVDGSGYRRSVTVPAGANEVRVPNLPEGVALTFDVVLPSGEKASFNLPAECGASAVVDLPAPAAEVVDVTFSVDLSCTLRLQPPFNASLMYKVAGTPGGGRSAGVPEWDTDAQGRVNGGTLTIPGMLLGSTYRFTLVTPDETASDEIRITGSEMHYQVDVPGDLCRK